ncbi:hypothetical protein [uncultured Mesonia sp.]|uniref:hypothetical protein n=1 Tax=uncultured Mesonia sp. TaxID=399731 RepID=UPI00374EAC68
MSKIYYFISLLFICGWQLSAQNTNIRALQLVEMAKEKLDKNYEFNQVNFDFIYQLNKDELIDELQIEIKKHSELGAQATKQLQRKVEKLIDKEPLLTNQYKTLTQGKASITNKKLQFNDFTKKAKGGDSIGFISPTTPIYEILTEQLDKDDTYQLKSGMFTCQENANLNQCNNYTANTENLKLDIEEALEDSNLTSRKFEYDFLYQTYNYDYSIKSIKEMDSTAIAEIEFKPKKENASYTGSMHIDLKTQAIVKLNYRLLPGHTTASFNAKFLLGFKTVTTELDKTIIYQKLANGKYFPAHLIIHKTIKLWGNRTIKLKGNKSNNRLKLEFTKGSKEKIKQKMLFNQATPMAQSSSDIK